MDGLARRELLKEAALGVALMPVVTAGMAAAAAEREEAKGMMKEMAGEMMELEGKPIHRIKDLKNMTDMEKAHLVTIDLPTEVKAGEAFKATFNMPNHPMMKAHHIMWMRVYLDGELISTTTFTPEVARPEVTLTFTLAKGRKFEAIGDCNLHGLWAMSAPIEIKA